MAEKKSEAKAEKKTPSSKGKTVKFEFLRDLNLGKITSDGQIVFGKAGEVVECEYSDKTAPVIDQAEKDGMIKIQ